MIDPESGAPLPGEYVVGWIKRGPSGVIGTNKKDAQETVDAISPTCRRTTGIRQRRRTIPPSPTPARWRSCCASASPSSSRMRAGRRSTATSAALGESAGRPRVKLTRIEEMLERRRLRRPLSSVDARSPRRMAICQTVAREPR